MITVKIKAIISFPLFNFEKGGIIMLEKIKIKITNFLEKIAKENKNSFGDEKLDCCKLNKTKRNKCKQISKF